MKARPYTHTHAHNSTVRNAYDMYTHLPMHNARIIHAMCDTTSMKKLMKTGVNLISWAV